jgi:pimeloyl-ACP methyl ester carboxylesterase
VVPTNELLNVLPRTAAGQRASWVWQRLREVAAGAPPPPAVELAEQYAPRWLDEVPVAGVFSQLAPLTSAVARAHEEAASRPNELKMLLELSDGSVLRFRCEVEATPPHRIVFQLVSPAMAPSKYVDRRVKRDGRDVNIRDFGGEGPLLLLWHGSGCDVTVWEAVVPHLRSFRVIAQDLPGHGGSALTRLSASDAIADADALLASLDLGKPVVVGHSVGGWLALRFATTRPCRALVGLDGPSALDYDAMDLHADHPGLVPDPPDVPAELAKLRCPAMIVLCSGASEAEKQWMAPFRVGLSEHLAERHPEIRVQWQPSDHMVVLSDPERTAALIGEFLNTAI